MQHFYNFWSGFSHLFVGLTAPQQYRLDNGFAQDRQNLQADMHQTVYTLNRTTEETCKAYGIQTR